MAYKTEADIILQKLEEMERRRGEMEARRLAEQKLAIRTGKPVVSAPVAQPYTISAPAAPAAAPAPTKVESYTPGATVNTAYQKYLEQMKAKPGAFTVNPYHQSTLVTQYGDRANEIYGNKPGAYESQYQPRIEQMFNEILGRGPFKYDMNADKLYQQAKDRYTQQANMGMQNAMGQAAAMTGGYGNSYAQSVGQQTFDTTMQGLNDMVPQLEQRAFDRWQAEGQDKMQQLGIMQGLEDRAYGMYQDELGNWRQDFNSALDQFYNERNFDYGQYADNRNFDYGAYRDQVGDWMSMLDHYYNQYQGERGFDYGKFADQRAYDYGKFADQRAHDFQVEQFNFQKQKDAEAKAAAEAAAEAAAAAAAEAAAAAAAAPKRSGGSSKKANPNEELFQKMYELEQERDRLLLKDIESKKIMNIPGGR